nr:hypothetical protein [Dyadobacter sp. NIV53]
MAEDKMMRLSQVARILNVGITTIVDHLSAKGYKVESNPNTKINSDQIEFLAKDFKSEDLRTSLVAKPVTHEVPAETKEDKVKSDVDGILYFRNNPAKPAEEKKQVEEKTEAALPALENRLPGIKVIGKIDLDAKKPVYQTPPPVPAPAPAVVEPKVEEPVKAISAEEKKPVEQAPAPAVKEQEKPEAAIPAKPEVVVTAPVEAVKEIVQPEKVEIKVEKPVEAKPVVEEKQPVQEVVVSKAEIIPTETIIEKPAVIEAKPETPELVKTEIKPLPEQEAAMPESGGSDLIEARGEQLRGLRVIGKIELPSDKAKKKDPVASSSDTAADKKRRRKRKRIRDGVVTPGDARPATTVTATIGTPTGTTNSTGTNQTPRPPRDANATPGNRTDRTNNRPPATGTIRNDGSGWHNWQYYTRYR